ncbi:MAG TPA: FAD-binding protein [Trebonia sp.]|jgi:succinate dehydrogenase/fumarate reductase flavoprotein subunit|nr:FAD-binding protein [Trebonia sp.]
MTAAHIEIDQVTTDVLIAGTGGAGMRAAIEARRAGVDVTVLAKGPVRATHTRMSGGRFNAMSGQNPTDNHDIFFEDTLRGGSQLNNRRLARILVEEAMDRAYDLESWGLVWERKESDRYLLAGSGGGTQLRMLGSFDEGIGITEVMLHVMRGMGTHVAENHMLVDIVFDDAGAVTGALALDVRAGRWKFFQAGAVIVATGGTSQLYETNSGPALNTGDGIALAYRAGAELVDIEFMQFIPISFVFPPSIRGYTLTEPPFYGTRHLDINGEPGHLLNTNGERFILRHDPVRREGGTRDVLARAIMLEILEGRGTPEGGVWLKPDPAVAPHFQRERPLYTKRILENYGERAARFEEAFQVMPSALYTTGGIRIDPWGHTTVPGLYAAGEAAGGVHGANRLGASSMPDIQVFGRRAGLTAAAECRERHGDAGQGLRWARSRAEALEGPLTRDSGGGPAELKRRLQNLTTTEVGLVRSAAGLQGARETLERYRAEELPKLRTHGSTRVLNREWMETIELENMIDVLGAMTAAALARTETRGAHYRQDFPDRDDDEWLANLYVRRVAGADKAEKRPLVQLAASASEVV